MAVHRKVQSATAAAAVSGVVVWALGRFVLHGSLDAAETAGVYAAVPAVLTFAAGWLTPAVRAPKRPKPRQPAGPPASNPPLTRLPPAASESIAQPPASPTTPGSAP